MTPGAAAAYVAPATEPEAAAATATREIAGLIRRRAEESQPCLLGLAGYEAIEAFVRWRGGPPRGGSA